MSCQTDNAQTDYCQSLSTIYLEKSSPPLFTSLHTHHLLYTLLSSPNPTSVPYSNQRGYIEHCQRIPLIGALLSSPMMFAAVDVFCALLLPVSLPPLTLLFFTLTSLTFPPYSSALSLLPPPCTLPLPQSPCQLECTTWTLCMVYR